MLRSSLESVLQEQLQSEELKTVGTAFGGSLGKGGSFSVPRIRDVILEHSQYPSGGQLEEAVSRTARAFARHRDFHKQLVSRALRFAFLIELTNLDVGSTKMKTRWLPGLILKEQPGSYEPKPTEFQPGTDPRAATFEECVAVFCKILNGAADAASSEYCATIQRLTEYTHVAYEFPVTYLDPSREECHAASNTMLILPGSIHWERIKWLTAVREILYMTKGAIGTGLTKIMAKIEVKVYKTDRSLTGKDKTNRAKRWEVLWGDFQHAAIQDCWSVEQALTEGLIWMTDFPTEIRERLFAISAITEQTSFTRCPVTAEPLSFLALCDAVLNPLHGRAEYQIGHKTPLKAQGKHVGGNICWQSADGNRIQGSLTIEKTDELLVRIFRNRGFK
jgi:hypothetical protein